MDSKTNKILAKLSKEKGLKKVQLSLVDDVEEAVGRGYSMLEFWEEAYDEARAAYIKANDIIRFDANDAWGEADSLLEDLLQEIKELGVDMPPRVKQLQKEVQDLESEIQVAEGRMKAL